MWYNIFIALERPVETRKVFFQRHAVVVVHHETFAAGRGAFHLHECPSGKEGIDFPVSAFRRAPVELSVGAYMARHVDTPAPSGGNHALEGRHGTLLFVRHYDGFLQFLSAG